MGWKLLKDGALLDEIEDDQISIDPGSDQTQDPGHVEFSTQASLVPLGEYVLTHDTGLHWIIVVDAGSDFVSGEIRAEIMSCDA